MSEGIEGADIVGALLRADAAITAKVPEDRIKIAALPEGEVLPHILIGTTTTLERKTLIREAVVRTVERVSVRVRAENLRDQRLLRRLVVRCCAGRTGDIGGGSSVSITTDGAGPEGRGTDNAFERVQDLRVSHDATV
ncbi:hypothetical protein SAMN03159338_4275 [Sphingomonas sp. NFR04]|uniref:tail completion protein gp17 n=1 Tax=Sphingomonas sp. NFR04 TaxID=1566283 RepID=UPI0008E78431|nr:hypothetical protein [Sphingomonas sp. NFR04]SFK44581.1 hypothetical protein SAMN03159338_4275 [Sphingomonas sp. NFR04]